MIRILHVVGFLDRGGIENMLMNLYRSSNRQLIQFDFVVHGEQRGCFEKEVEALGGRIFRCPDLGLTSYYKYKKWWKTFFDTNNDHRIVHIHTRGSAYIVNKEAKKNGRVTIIHCHSTSNGHNLSAIAKDFLQKKIRHKADYYFACSVKAGNWMFGHKIVKSKKFYFFPNCIDVSKYSFNAINREEVRKTLGIKSDEVVIGHVGRFVKAKNHIFILKAFKMYMVSNPLSKLLLIGSGPLLKAIKLWCEKNGISNSVIIVQNSLDTAKYYNAMDIFWFPSLWEGFGLALLEAQCNGLFCLASKTLPDEVLLTSKTSFMQLSCDNWCNVTLKKTKEIYERKLDKADCDNLSRFDSTNVANWLSNFYLKIIF